MKQIPLTKGKDTIVDDDDFEKFGLLKWHITSTGYAVRATARPNRRRQLLHRLIVNAPDDMEVDHINGDTLDNRKCNLRLATRLENCLNRKVQQILWRICKTKYFGGLNMLLLEPYFQKQAELEAKILEKAEPMEPQEHFLYLLTALQVEVGECCNEWRVFKYWSKDRQPRREKMLEEYVDCFHFILSIGLMLGKNPAELSKASFPSSPTEHLGTPIQHFALLNKFISMLHEDDSYEYVLMAFLDLGYILGFTWEEVTDDYKRKHAINHTRQADGY